MHNFSIPMKLPSIVYCRVVTYVLQTGNLRVKSLITFRSKKISSEHIDMGSSFEDLDTTSLTVKADHKSDKRFHVHNILNSRISH